MTRRQRKILFYFFVLIFCITTPSIWIYANGYKVRLTWPIRPKQLLQKTGMLVLESEPKGASVFVDDKIQEFSWNSLPGQDKYVTTPAKIKGILPGEHKIRIELNDYWPWEKKIQLKPGQSLGIKDISLFKKNLPLLVSDIKTESIYRCQKKDQGSDSSNFLAVGNKDELVFFDTAEEKTYRFELKDWVLPSNQEEAYIGRRGAILAGSFFDFSSLERKDLQSFIGNKTSHYHWSDSDDNKIYYQKEEFIGLLDLKNNSVQKILEGRYFDYLVKKDTIFTLSNENKKTKLKTFSLRNNQLLKEIILPYSTTYTFINYQHSLLNIYNPKKQQLYLVDPWAQTNPLKKLVSGVNLTYWLDDNRLLYTGNFEVWLIDIENNSEELITRIGENINGLGWHPNGTHLVYSTEKNVFILELFNPIKQSSTLLCCFSQNKTMRLDSSGENIYLLGKIGRQEGVFKLSIQ